nr:MAG TPA: hypothetical protein [Caudoviricetes sp.]
MRRVFPISHRIRRQTRLNRTANCSASSCILSSESNAPPPFLQ